MTPFNDRRSKLPGELHSVAHQVEIIMQAPIELIDTVILAAASTAVQASCMVERKPGLSSPVSLFLLTICDPGERKSAVQSLVFKAISELQRERIREGEVKKQQHSKEHMKWKEKSRRLRSEINIALKKGKDIDEIEMRQAAHMDEEPILEAMPKIVFEDATPEALLSGLSGTDKSVALIYDELSSFVNGHMSRKTAILNSIWSGKDTSVDRNTRPSFEIQNPRLTCLLQAQPAVFDKFLKAANEEIRGNGFLSRVLLAYPISTQGERFNYYPNTDIRHPCLEWFYERCRTLLGRKEQCVLRFSRESQSRWIQIADYYEENIQEGRPFSKIRDFASKAAENIARVAAVIHGFSVDDCEEISVQNLEAAFEIMDWHRQQYQSLVLTSYPDPETEFNNDLEFLFEWMRDVAASKGWVGMYRSYVQQYGPNRLRGDGKIKKLLDAMEDLRRLNIEYHERKKFFRL